ncbi:MAG: hypothetical protein DMG97_21885 [Acidobacteria bacterium]|nr:MAG: hypothetical protein DMG97_21885 [Acidobacteriota bacterium]PYV72807.1 MAG: hypothetical protein DMG96_25025 [Acidobacteriota bacterium]
MRGLRVLRSMKEKAGRQKIAWHPPLVSAWRARQLCVRAFACAVLPKVARRRSAVRSVFWVAMWMGESVNGIL